MDIKKRRSFAALYRRARQMIVSGEECFSCCAISSAKVSHPDPGISGHGYDSQIPERLLYQKMFDLRALDQTFAENALSPSHRMLMQELALLLAAEFVMTDGDVLNASLLRNGYKRCLECACEWLGQVLECPECL